MRSLKKWRRKIAICALARATYSEKNGNAESRHSPVQFNSFPMFDRATHLARTSDDEIATHSPVRRIPTSGFLAGRRVKKKSGRTRRQLRTCAEPSYLVRRDKPIAYRQLLSRASINSSSDVRARDTTLGTGRTTRKTNEGNRAKWDATSRQPVTLVNEFDCLRYFIPVQLQSCYAAWSYLSEQKRHVKHCERQTSGTYSAE